MANRTAHSSWTGGLSDGSGTGRAAQLGADTFAVFFPKRTANAADGTTSPEELVGAAHASCYAMQFSGVIAANGGTPKSLEITANVSLGADPAGGLRLTGIELVVCGTVEGMDEAGFVAAAENAKETCPVSKALTGVEITLDAALA